MVEMRGKKVPGSNSNHLRFVLTVCVSSDRDQLEERPEQWTHFLKYCTNSNKKYSH